VCLFLEKKVDGGLYLRAVCDGDLTVFPSEEIAHPAHAFRILPSG